MGFTCGYSVGEEAGWRDGYIFGMRKGAQLSAEIGYYQGFAHAWISILEHEDTNKQRKLNALHSLLEMTRSFPRTNNIMEDDTVQKLARIRAKFKQVNALILGTGTASFFSSSFSGGGGSSGASGGGMPTASQGAGTTHSHAPHLGGIYNRGSQESGVSHASSFRGVSPTANNNSCLHHHHNHPPNVEMSF
ncbi:Yae1 N terminal domain containing protein [Euroglyphus maynei]|uniref:Yae1 N terminal domain containing protein n=1 Tax=Euroglyphus maynei TaxID=6958 RepID=A0A1Y3BNY6_EURMA|nr:Yae1 N terminal domain containing protein [Euroglyphus maynei]